MIRARSVVVCVALTRLVPAWGAPPVEEWPRHEARPAVALDGEWAFRMDPGGIGERDGWFNAGVPFGDRIAVPGSWDAQGFGEPTDKVRHNYLGKAWYRRVVDVPSSWVGKRAYLCVGGVHRYADVWVNGRHVARHVGYVTPFEADVTDNIMPGSPAAIAIRVDSAQDWSIDCLTGCFDIIDYMDVNWGGIWGHVRLEARSPTFIEDAFVKPDVGAAAADVEVSTSVASGSASPMLRATVIAPDGRQVAATEQAAASSVSLTLPVPGALVWSPNHPWLYRLKLELRHRGRVVDSWEDRFGMRQIEIRGADVYLNGNRVFLHGYGDDCVFPDTLVPPASHDAYRRRFGLAKQFGMNYVRHHSHVPVPEYFDIADEMGLLIQPELPIAYEPFFDRAKGSPAALDLYRQTWDGMIRRLRNHASLFAWCMGNEMYNGFALGEELYDRAKALDPTRPVYDSDGLPSGPDVRDGRWGRRTLDLFPLQFDVSSLAFRAAADKYDFKGTPQRPVIVHEMGNFVTYPSIADIRLFRGAAKPFWLERARSELERRGLLDQAGLFADGSARLQAVCHKVEVEAVRSSPQTDGHALWLLQDYWTGSSGLVNAHYRVKGPGPEWYRRFIADVVVLAKLPRRTFEAGEGVSVPVSLSDYGEADIRDATARWRLTGPGSTLAEGTLGPLHAVAKGVSPLGEIALRMPGLSRAEKVNLSVELDSPEARAANDWDLWVYPRALALDLPGGVRVGRVGASAVSELWPEVRAVGEGQAPLSDYRVVVTRRLTEDLVRFTDRGGRVLLTDPRGAMPTEVTTFEPAWWMGGAGSDANTGTVIGSHSALAEFPNDEFCDLQFFDLVHQRPAMLLDDLPVRVDPIVRALDVYMSSRSKGLLVEARVGQGRLLLSSFDLSGTSLETRPEARWLLRSLIRYLATDRSTPKAELPASYWLEHLSEAPVPANSARVEGFAGVTAHNGEVVTHPSYRDPNAAGYVVRGLDGSWFIEWQTAPVPPGPEESVTFAWAGALGWVSMPEAGFDLSLDGTPLVTFGVTRESARWRSPDGRRTLAFDSRVLYGSEDTLGVFYLTVPRDMLRAGEPAALRVSGQAANSRRWFMLQEYTDLWAAEEE